MLKEGAICHPDRVLLVGANSLGTVPPRLFFDCAANFNAGRRSVSCERIACWYIRRQDDRRASPRSGRSFDGHSFAEKIRNVTKVKSLLFANVGERALQCCLC
jgi:hypothetical protein